MSEQDENSSAVDTEGSRQTKNRALMKRLTELFLAYKNDLRNILSSLWKHVDIQFDGVWKSGDWLDGDCDQSAVCQRLGRALELVAFDLEDAATLGESDGTIDAALGRMLELMMDPEFLSTADHASNEDPDEWRADQLIEIQCCMIALLIQGRFRDAVDIGRILIACSSIRKDPNMQNLFKAGKRKELGPDLDKLKVLDTLADDLRENRLPTLKNLRVKAFPNGKDEGSFSRLIKDLNTKKHLPRESTGRGNPEAGTTSSPSGRPDFPADDLKEKIGKADMERFNRVEDERIGAETSGTRSLKPTGDGSMVDVEIRRIKERFGPLYHMFLIMFELKDLEDQEDLARFEEYLANIGLAFA